MQVPGSHAVITGASRGIGESIARELAKRGALVTLVARNEIAITHLAKELGGHHVAADLADPTQVDGLMARCEKAAGRPVDILVNNAGIDVTKRFTDMTSAEVADIHQINLISPIELCRQLIPGLIERGSGHIVNVSSMASSAGFPGLSVYCSTKAGLSQFTRVVRQDLKDTPVKLTAVEIGPVPTDMLANVNDYSPTDRSFARFRRLQVMPIVPRERVAQHTANAIERDKNAVWLPKRAGVFPFITSIPQRITALIIRDIKP